MRGQNEPRNGDTAVICYADSSTLSSSVYDEGMENDYNRVIASAASMPDSADISAVIGLLAGNARQLDRHQSRVLGHDYPELYADIHRARPKCSALALVEPLGEY